MNTTNQKHINSSDRNEGIDVAKETFDIHKQFYKHLLDQARKKKVAITTCMHKMITILNTMVRYDQEWLMN